MRDSLFICDTFKQLFSIFAEKVNLIWHSGGTEEGDKEPGKT